MSDPDDFWQPLGGIVDLFTKEGVRNLAGFLLLMISGVAVVFTAMYLLMGHGP